MLVLPKSFGKARTPYINKKKILGAVGEKSRM